MSVADQTESRRKAILNAAMALFDRQGYAATTMEEVAAGAGISKGSVYNYFQSKQDLFAQLFTATNADDETEAAYLFDGSLEPTAAIEGLLDFWYTSLERHLRVGRLTLEFWAAAAREERNGPLAELLQGTYRGWLDWIAPVIANGVVTGEFQTDLDPRAAATLLVGVLHGLLLQLILNLGVTVDDEFLPSLKQAVLAALGAPEDETTQGPVRE
jgi:AcrR family transcriptional regulator